jgi:oxygen-dependent protoporphyrinogen oxidase
MENDIVVVGAGISGLAFAAHAARAGRSVVLLEARPGAGGSLATRGGPGGFWIELGAHTCYNSYGALIELVEMAGLTGRLQPRGKPVLRFLDGDEVVPGKNLGALLRRMKVWELMKALPGAFRASPAGQSVRAYYSRLVGAANYERALSPMLTAVPSQPADDLPADMLFKKRPRRKDVMRSFTFQGGLGTLAGALARFPRVRVETGTRATRIARAGAGYRVETASGGIEEGRAVVVAAPPLAAARLLSEVAPEAARLAGGLREAEVDSTGVVVRAERVALPYSTFFIPIADTFYSVVTRDVVPDPTWRGFVFHFRPGSSLDERVARITRVLRVPRGDLEQVVELRQVVPSPVVGHGETIAALDRAIEGTPVAVLGNWFGGLALEDCVLRARAEWGRVAAALGDEEAPGLVA